MALIGLSRAVTWFVQSLFQAEEQKLETKTYSALIGRFLSKNRHAFSVSTSCKLSILLFWLEFL